MNSKADAIERTTWKPGQSEMPLLKKTFHCLTCTLKLLNIRGEKYLDCLGRRNVMNNFSDVLDITQITETIDEIIKEFFLYSSQLDTFTMAQECQPEI